MLEFIQIFLPLAAGITTVIWGIVQYFDGKYAKLYKENVESLFSERKEIVLSAIATLAYFKGKRKFKSNVIDILLNRLYTELDTDIINSIISELAQVISDREFEYVLQKLIDVNRNFELQTPIIEIRRDDFKSIYDQHIDDLKDIVFETNENFKNDHFDRIIESKKQFKKYEGLSKSILKWHKQVSAQAIAMLVLEAQRRETAKELKINFFENNFSYSHLFDFSIKLFNVAYSAFSYSSLQELIVERLIVKHSFFENSILRRCHFRGGLLSNIEIINTKLDWVVFNNIEFDDVLFIGVEFNNCQFSNIQGLNPILFYNCKIISESTFDNIELFDKKLINSSTKEELIDWLKNSKRSLWGRDFIQRKLNEQVVMIF